MRKRTHAHALHAVSLARRLLSKLDYSESRICEQTRLCSNTHVPHQVACVSVRLTAECSAVLLSLGELLYKWARGRAQGLSQRTEICTETIQGLKQQCAMVQLAVQAFADSCRPGRPRGMPTPCCLTGQSAQSSNSELLPPQLPGLVALSCDPSGGQHWELLCMRACGCAGLKRCPHRSRCSAWARPAGGAALWLETLVSGQAGNRAAWPGAVAGDRITALIRAADHE